MYSISETAERTGMSTHALRYYDNEGLLMPLNRTPSGVRRFTEEDIWLLDLITCLRSTGMPIRKIRECMGLRSAGDSTLQARHDLLEEQKNDVEMKIRELQQYLKTVGMVLDFYKDAMVNGYRDALERVDIRALETVLHKGKFGHLTQQ